MALATTSLSGDYSFSGLESGTYCVAIDALSPENALLLPGGWTFPAASGERPVAAYTLSLLGGDRASEINFGWDYQFLPVPEPVVTVLPSPTPTVTGVPPLPIVLPVAPSWNSEA